MFSEDADHSRLAFLEYIFNMYILSSMHFEWDEDKAQQNNRKHRVSFEQAKEVFDDPRAVPFEDLEHSSHEETRYVMIGMSSIGLLFVSFAYADEIVRLISARRAEKWMVKVYEDKK